MDYNKDFENFVNTCLNLKSYVGTGNPNSEIIIVGKETAIDIKKVEEGNLFESKNLQNYNQNAADWKENIKNKICQDEIADWNKDIYCSDYKAKNNPLFSYKGIVLSEHMEGQTYRKYQKLYDLIFNMKTEKNEKYNFQENFFITELNDSPNKNTHNANKDSLKSRKELFKNEPFIQNFKVIILACSNYITNTGEGDEREIDTIFNVKFTPKSIAKKLINQKFWVHKNESGSKLVIHTRQLSANVSDELLEEIAKEVREHLKIN